MIYYGLRKNETVGKLNPKIRESVIAIKLYDTNCMNDHDVDSRLRDHKYYSSIDPDDREALINAVWNSGNLEILFEAIVLRGDSLYVLCNNAISVHAKELFDIKKITRKHYHATWFTKNEYWYIGEYVDLVPKWYYLPEPLKFRSWNPAEESTIINLKIWEVDGMEEYKVTEKFKKQEGLSLEAQIGDKFSIKFNRDSEIKEVTREYMIKKSSDKLGNIEMRFDDYVIRGRSDNQYELNTYYTGKISFILVPLK